MRDRVRILEIADTRRRTFDSCRIGLATPSSPYLPHLVIPGCSVISSATAPTSAALLLPPPPRSLYCSNCWVCSAPLPRLLPQPGRSRHHVHVLGRWPDRLVDCPASQTSPLKFVVSDRVPPVDLGFRPGPCGGPLASCSPASYSVALMIVSGLH